MTPTNIVEVIKTPIILLGLGTRSSRFSNVSDFFRNNCIQEIFDVFKAKQTTKYSEILEHSCKELEQTRTNTRWTALSNAVTRHNPSLCLFNLFEHFVLKCRFVLILCNIYCD